MAGIDFFVTCCQPHRPFLRDLLRFTQRQSRRYDVKLTYSWSHEGYRVELDGPLTWMQASLESVPQYVRGFAFGHPGPPSLRGRTRVCERFLSGYTRAIWEITKSVAELAACTGGIPQSYHFDVGKKTHLSGPMNDFTAALILAHNGRLSASQLLESAHTSLELLMRSALGSVIGSFETLVTASVEAGLIGTEQASELLALKDYRKKAKHRGQGIKMEKAWQLAAAAVKASHQLLAVIRRCDLDTDHQAPT